jgi:hypothetical protein
LIDKERKKNYRLSKHQLKQVSWGFSTTRLLQRT